MEALLLILEKNYSIEQAYIYGPVRRATIPFGYGFIGALGKSESEDLTGEKELSHLFLETHLGPHSPLPPLLPLLLGYPLQYEDSYSLSSSFIFVIEGSP